MSKLSARENLLLGVLATGLIALWLGLPEDPGSLRHANDEASTEIMYFGDPPVVRIDLLGLKTAAFDPPGRNLFAYHEPRKLLRPAETSRETTIVPPPPPPIAPTTSMQSAQPSRPAPAFTYIGFLGPKDELIAVFNRGTEVFIAQVGDVIDNSFKLLGFRHEAVVLGCVGGQFNGKTVELRKRSS
jgi:hypothetical protein